MRIVRSHVSTVIGEKSNLNIFLYYAASLKEDTRMKDLSIRIHQDKDDPFLHRNSTRLLNPTL
jgi:hypothetical protein